MREAAGFTLFPYTTLFRSVLLAGSSATSVVADTTGDDWEADRLDRKSTRLNSSHPSISYAVFCLKKKITDALAMHIAESSCPPLFHLLVRPCTLQLLLSSC